MAGLIGPNSTVILSSMCAEPQTIVESLLAQNERFSNLTIYTMFPVSSCPYADREMEGRFKVKAFSVGKLSQAVKRGQAEYVPIHFSQIGRLIKNRKISLDAVLLQLSPPDEDGNCNMGISVEYFREAIDAADIVIGELNERMPRTNGDTLLPIDRLDYFIEVSRPLLTYDVGHTSEVEDRIGEFVAELIPDGAVLQYGPGKVHKATFKKLAHKKDLGIHSGLISDEIVPLVKNGVITGAKKEVDANKIVATGVIGTQIIYDFVHENEMVEIRSSNHTHDIKIMSQFKNFISLNSAIEVDLLGQANSESVGLNVVNGVGGMMDFVRGAISSEGGKAVLALPSTARKGEKSRIVPILNQGVVTAGWADLHYIVTEHGVADLCGLTVSERVKKMISIAHPRFRDGLTRKAIEMSLI